MSALRGRTTAGLAVSAALLAAAQGRPAETRRTGPVDRGRYLVEQVAMCVQCHTPRDSEGRLLRDRLLQGAPVPVTSPFRGEDWAIEAPGIAGMKGYTEETGIRLLTEGLGRTGEPLRPPMPPFRLTREDAEAVVAYLISLR